MNNSNLFYDNDFIVFPILLLSALSRLKSSGSSMAFYLKKKNKKIRKRAWILNQPRSTSYVS